MRGRLPQSNLAAAGSNIAVVAAYAALIAGFARLHRVDAGRHESMHTH